MKYKLEESVSEEISGNIRSTEGLKQILNTDASLKESILLACHFLKNTNHLINVGNGI